MKSLKNKLRKSKKDFEILSIKDINKKVKDLLAIKEKEKEKDAEINLILIIKSLNIILYNHSNNLYSNVDNLRQELNFTDIESYLNQFQSKPYYKYKIFPLLEILKELYLKTKKEKAFLNCAKEMNITINQDNRITDSQIDRLNYMLIMQYERFLLLDNEIFDVFVFLKDIFTYLKDDYKYLLDYYILIQLHTYILIGTQKLKENHKNFSDKKKRINITKILFDIIYKINNNTLIELAFILFCQHYLYFRDNSFVFLPINKWVFLILKLLKGEINLINEDKDKEYYYLSKLIHLKYTIGETERNKKREKLEEDLRKSTNSSSKDLPNNSQRNTIDKIDKPENINEFLEDNTYEIYPSDLFLSKGPSEIFIINLFKYNQNEKENMKKNKEYYINQKIEIIQGALVIADKIMKFNYDSKEYIDYDEKYFCIRLFDEIIKLYHKIDELHFIKRCLNCFGTILLKCPNYIIDYIPQIIIRLSENALSGKIENLVNQLNYFFQSCNTIFQKAFSDNDTELINKINKITKNNSMMRSIVLLNPFIFKLKILKLNNSKNSHDKIVVNIQSLITNYFIFCTTLVYNNLILSNCIMSIYIEVIIIYFIEKSSQDLIRKYMIKVITKIYREKLLTRIFNYLLIDEDGNLKLKTLFYILRHISLDKYNKTNLPYLIKFLEKNNKINTSSASIILDFLAKHFININTKFYFIDFYKDKNSTKILSSEITNDDNEYVEVYDTLNPKNNVKIFKYIMKIFFLCMSETKEFDDICNVQKILSMIFINMAVLEKYNIYLLFQFLTEYLNNITQMINSQGLKIWQNYFKQYLEILNYANSYINIKNSNFKDNKDIDKKYLETLIDTYNKIILNLFKLIPNNLSSKDYDILNIIPIIYSFLLTLDNMTTLYKKENIDNQKNINNNENNISIELLNLLNKYLTNNKIKTQTTFNSCNISLFYIFYYLKNISKKEYFDIIYSIIIKSLNIDEFKYENNVINAVNFILIKLCVKILYEEKDYITKEEDEVLSMYDKKYQIIQKLHGIIKQNINDDRNNNNNINSINMDESINLNIINPQDIEKKTELLRKYLNFSSNSNFIDINMDKYNNLDKIQDIEIEKYTETKDNDNCRYQKWLIFIEMLAKSKAKKSLSSDINDNIDFLLNSSFSFTEKKPIHFISIIKSLELDNNDFKLFLNFISILGNIIINEKEIALKKENIFENIIYRFDKNILHGVVFVLIKQYFEELDAHFSCNFIFYIKPLSLEGIYFIKIQKNSDFKMKNNNAFKLLTQIDQDVNKIFSDFIILDTNDEKQINYFYNIIEIIFNYSFLEEQINA